MYIYIVTDSLSPYVRFCFFFIDLPCNSRSFQWAGRLVLSMGYLQIPAFQIKMFCQGEVPGAFSTSVSSENEVKAVNTDQKSKGS